MIYSFYTYSDIYTGEIPDLNDVLKSITSKRVVIRMAQANTELFDKANAELVQKRLTDFFLQNLLPEDRALIETQLYQNGVNQSERKLLWNHFCIQKLMEVAITNYDFVEDLKDDSVEELNVLKAYLIVAENYLKRHSEITKEIIKQYETSSEKGIEDPFIREKVIWPIHFETYGFNSQNDISRYFKLIALVKYCIENPVLSKYWQQYLLANGCSTSAKFLGSLKYFFDLAYTDRNDPYLKRYVKINPEEVPLHLVNLSLDVKVFQNDPDKQVYFKGLQEWPLFRVSKDLFIPLSYEYLLNKTYNGCLFELFYNTDLAKNQVKDFNTFENYKSQIGKEIVEKIVFQGLLRKLFIKQDVKVFFDDGIFKQVRKGNNISVPDAYLRIGNKVFLFEFKDLVVRGDVIESGSFEKIQGYLDKRLNSRKAKELSGVGQLLNQLETLANEKFDFDKFTDEPISVYPMIVHTNFIFRTPMINTYLSGELLKWSKDIPNLTGLRMHSLTLIDLATFFNFCRIKKFDLIQFERYLNFYKYVVDSREFVFLQNRSSETNFAAGVSFDEIFEQKILPYEPRREESIVHFLLEVIGANEEIFETFQDLKLH